MSGTLGARRLTKREKAFSAETLVTALCVFAVLRTHPIHFTLIHICPKRRGGEKKKEREKMHELNVSAFKWTEHMND